MPEGATLILFLVATFVLLVIPGPSVLYIVARSLSQGWRAGIVSTLGISTGTLCHVFAAAFGLSALLVSSAFVFTIVKYLGAAYLIYLGIRTLLTRPEMHPLTGVSQKSLAQIFAQGVLVNVLNPKTALFFFAFLPQFVDPAKGAVSVQILVLGAILVVLGLCSDGLYALLAGSIRHWLQRNQSALRAQPYIAGSVYVALGLTTALTGPSHQ